MKAEIEISELIPENRLFATERSKNTITLRYLRTGKGGKNSNWITLPRRILITPEIAIAIGIYYAVVKHWSEITSLPRANFIKSYRATTKQKYVRNRKKPPLYGLLEIYYSSVIVRDVIDGLLERTKLLCLENSDIRRAFLKGMFAGEGSVKLINNRLREIRIACCNKKEQEFLRMLLIKEKIIPSNAKYAFYISISNSTNFNRINSTGMITAHPEKKYAFDIGYKNLLLLSGK